MRRYRLIPFIIIFLQVLLGCNSEQKPSALPAPQVTRAITQNPEKVAAEIRIYEDRLLKAYTQRDTTALLQLMDDYFTMGLPTGIGFGSKFTELDLLQKPIGKGFVLTNDTMQVQVHGDVAIVTKLFIEKGQYNGKDVSNESIWTDTWMKKDERWVLIASHGTYIPKQGE